MDYEKLHEMEEVWLFPHGEPEWQELKAVLKNAGLKYYDDQFTLLRKGRVPDWQSRSVVDVAFFLDQREVFDPERPGAAWDRLRLSYLLASLPSQFATVFVDVVVNIATQLHCDLVYRGKSVQGDELRDGLTKAIEEVELHFGVPGTEKLAIQIEMTYPRNSANG